MKTTGLIASLIIIVALVFLLGYKEIALSHAKEANKMYESLDNDYQVLTGSYENLKELHLRKQDSLTKLLREATTKNTLSSTAFSTVTKDTIIITKYSQYGYIKYDTVYKDNKIVITPTYTYWNRDKFTDIFCTVNRDSCKIAYTIYDTYLVTQAEKRIKLFGPKETYINITSANPHSTVKDNSSYYRVKTKKQWKGLIFIGGILAGLGTAALVK